MLRFKSAKGGCLAAIAILTLSGCATPRMRFLLGAGAGAAIAGGTAAALSPNKESEGMNALVFGLGGALLGGGIGLLLSDDSSIPRSEQNLRLWEAANPESSTLYKTPRPELPEFLKDRFQSPIVEESEESDRVSEDGTLHAPHKVYRIVRPAELVPPPSAKAPTSNQNIGANAPKQLEGNSSHD